MGKALLVFVWLAGWAGTSAAFCLNGEDRGRAFDVRDIIIPAFGWPAIVVGALCFNAIRLPPPPTSDRG
jgi:hypothetical protein